MLWIGTDDGGLDRWDRGSRTFTHFRNDPGDPTSLSSNRVRVIREDRQGMLWVGTDGGGLNRFDPARERFLRFAHNPSDPTSLSSDRVRAIFEDREGDLWIGTDGGGLDHYHRESGTFSHFLHAFTGSFASDIRSRFGGSNLLNPFFCQFCSRFS